MNIWFGATTAKWPKYHKNYFKIRDYIKGLNCEIPFDWLENADEAYKQKSQRNVTEIFNEVIKAIDLSNAVIIEYTIPNFSSSHQINYALLKKKPVLVLRLKKDNPYYNGSYLEALQSNLLTIKDYSLKDYRTIIKNFIERIGYSEKQQRYNIVLGQKQKTFLDWASIKYSKSKSQIIKDLLDKEAKVDGSYKII